MRTRCELFKTRRQISQPTASIQLDRVTLCEPLLYCRRERCDLSRPTVRVMLLKPVEELLEHIVQLHRRVVPANNGIAEPEQALRYSQITRSGVTISQQHTFAIPAGLCCTRVHKPRKAESFSSLSRISYKAWHHI